MIFVSDFTIQNQFFLEAKTLIVAQSMSQKDFITNQLRNTGMRFKTDRAIIWVEKHSLSASQIRALAQRINQGIIDVEELLGIRYNKPIEYYISSQIRVASALPKGKPYVYLPLVSVKQNSAPYVHETAHVLTLSGPRPLWLSEGIACYLETPINKQYENHNRSVFNPENKDIVDLAKNILNQDEGEMVLPLIGINQLPKDMSQQNKIIMSSIYQDRTDIAPAFYNLSHSFVKFLVDEYGIRKVLTIIRAENTEQAILENTGKTTSDLKKYWLKSLNY